MTTQITGRHHISFSRDNRDNADQIKARDRRLKEFAERHKLVESAYIRSTYNHGTREEMEPLIAGIINRKKELNDFDLILVWENEQLGQSPSYVLDVTYRLREVGVQIIDIDTAQRRKTFEGGITI